MLLSLAEHRLLFQQTGNDAVSGAPSPAVNVSPACGLRGESKSTESAAIEASNMAHRRVNNRYYQDTRVCQLLFRATLMEEVGVP